MTGIMGALDREVAALTELLENKTVADYGRLKVYSGKIFGKNTAVCVCGVGKVAAAYAATVLITAYGADTVINTGVAGGTVPRGTPVIADKLVQHDVRAYADGLPAGQIEGFDSPYLPADVKLCKELCAAAVACGLEPAVGTIASGDQFICGKEDVGRIKRTFGALAIDMESASAAQVCALAGVRFAALRTVTDNADDNAIEDYYELLNFAAAQSVSILTEYLKGSRE